MKGFLVLIIGVLVSIFLWNLHPVLGIFGIIFTFILWLRA
jgi:hypothetical protein